MTLEETKEVGKMPNRQQRGKKMEELPLGAYESAVAGDSLWLIEPHGPPEKAC